MRLPEFPHPPPAYDEHQITPLNGAWDIGAAAPSRRRAEGPARGVHLAHRRAAAAEAGGVQLAPGGSPQPQRGGAPRGAEARSPSIIALFRDQIGGPARVPLAAARSSCSRSRSTWTRRGGASEGQALVVNAAVNALAEELAKRWESMIAREQRFESRVAGLWRGARGAAIADRHLAAGVDDDEAGARAVRGERNSATPDRHDGRAATRPIRVMRRRPTLAPLRRRWTPTSTSGSRTSSADRRRRSARGSRAICPTSTARRTCSTSGAGAGSSSTC